MATLREIRRKLASVHNIQKITQAMEMVAASRLRRAQSKAEQSRPYFLKLQEILQQLITASTDFKHPLIEGREAKKTGIVIISGDRGLCGGYNNTIFTTSEKLLTKYNPSQVELIVIGRKGVDYFSGKKWKIGSKIVEWGGKITYRQVEDLANNLMNQFLNKELDEIWIVYTQYISISARKVMVEKLLNIDVKQSEGEKKKRTLNYIFEPNMEEIFSQLLPRYCTSKIQSALHESYASELAARIFSMRAATKNAEEMIEKLTLVRNKVRQSGITRELLEITACVESLK